MPKKHVLGFGFAYFFCLTAFGQTLYYDRDFQEIWSANTDGTNQTQLFVYPNSPTIDGFAYDGKNGYLFIAVSGQGPGFNVQSIDRINLDGTGHIQLINTGTQFNLAITYNPTDNKIYWLDQGTTRNILRANIDGSNQETVLTDADSAFRQIRIHIDNQQIFWTDAADPTISNVGTVRRAPVGTMVSATTVWTGFPFNTMEGFDLSFSTGEIFWVRDTNIIEKGNIDGTGMVTTVLSGASVGTNLEDIIVDRTNNKLFWQDLPTDTIRTANLDGSNVMTIIDGGAGGFSLSNGLAISNPDLPVELQTVGIE